MSIAMRSAAKTFTSEESLDLIETFKKQYFF